MSRLVCALAMTHNPRIYWSRVQPVKEEREAVLESFIKLRRIREETRAESLVVIANDHVTNFFLDNLPTFCVGLSEYAEGPSSAELEAGIPPYKTRVDYELASFILEYGIRHGFDLSRTMEFKIDHAFTVPLSFISPGMDIPIVPIFTNVHLPPIASPLRFYELGKMLGKAIESYEIDKRIGVVGSFNLSLNVGNARMGTYDDAFNGMVLGHVMEGRGEELLSKISIERIREAGNATVEFLNLAVLLGIIGDKKPEVIEHRIIHGWGTCPVIGWRLAKA